MKDNRIVDTEFKPAQQYSFVFNDSRDSWMLSWLLVDQKRTVADIKIIRCYSSIA